jgi:predicted GH43/DUF377 family glycosyl hydrolase
MNEPGYVVHNGQLAKAWLEKIGRVALFPAVSSQIPAVQINPKALHPFGYNGSLIRFEGRLLLAYRYHVDNKLSTKLAVAELDDNFNVIRNSNLEIAGNHQSSEDPRLFIYQGKLWMSYVCSTWPSQNPVCVTKYGMLNQISNGWGIVPQTEKQPAYGKNDGTSLEKNFIFWEHFSGELYCIHRSLPEQVIMGRDCELKSPAPRWAWGEIRGGCSPLPWQGKLLRFFHSSLDFEQPPARRRYFMGAALMEPDAPFRTLAVSKKPICVGSEIDDLTVEQRGEALSYKEKVIFPMGAIMLGDGFVVSAGCNDSSVLLLKIGPKDLNL